MSWFQTAVFYQVSIRSFCDGNGDGIGDFEGLITKLDYLKDLGVDCIWLMPFFASPLDDGGYDVSDYREVHPDLGTMEDVTRLIAEAHNRGLRVIGDMVLNHTSSQHEWFQEARQPGSAKRDWYVWTDDPNQWPEARVIFIDSETSNWAWDDVAEAYFWHRFYPHQPDLNYDNPEVLAEMLDVVRFWLSLGLDGLRLDAIPYLVERDGTNCDNLPETHAVIREVRALVDKEFPEAMLLAEANQMPRDVVEYFGDGDECHMCYHFPVMPRLFESLKRGTTATLVDALVDTPPIPDGAQWAMFLRNHDELTLEMVTPDEREWMWQQYAPDPRMKSNLGIRRRLAPLLDNDRRRIELLNAMLLSLPGSPFMYYGDEIGMGDNVWLHDRDGVRTPMQWDATPGAGFSEGEPDTFHLPLIDSDDFGPAAVNVASQLNAPDSLLAWTKKMLALRSEHPTFGDGSFELVAVTNPALLVFRRHGNEQLLVAANFSDTAQSVAGLTGSGRDLVAGGTVDLAALRLVPFGFAWAALD